MNNYKTNIIFDSKDMSLSVTTIMDNNLKVKVKDCYFKNVVEITKDTAIHSFDIPNMSSIILGLIIFSFLVYKFWNMVINKLIEIMFK